MIDGFAPHPDQKIIEAAERAVDDAWLETIRAEADEWRDRESEIASEAHALARAAFIVLGICALAMAAILFQAVRSGTCEL